MNSKGAMQTGWLNDGGTWYYLKSSGAMTTGWTPVGGTWYHMAASATMKLDGSRPVEPGITSTLPARCIPAGSSKEDLVLLQVRRSHGDRQLRHQRQSQPLLLLRSLARITSRPGFRSRTGIRNPDPEVQLPPNEMIDPKAITPGIMSPRPSSGALHRNPLPT